MLKLLIHYFKQTINFLCDNYFHRVPKTLQVKVFLMEFRIKDKEQAEKVVVKRMLEMQDEEDTKRFIKEV